MTKTMRLALVILLTCPFITVQAQDNTKTEATEKSLNSKEIRLLIDSLSNALNRWYIYPDKATLMINAIKNNYKNGVYKKINNPSELSSRLSLDLQEAHPDKHLNISYDPQFASDLETPMTDSMVKKQYDDELTLAREHNFSFKKAEILPGNIGYLRWDEFCNPSFFEESKLVFNGAVQIVKNCKAVIVDMRYNGGGYPDMVQLTQSYFFTRKTGMNNLIDRNYDTVKKWADPAKTDLKLTMPVYVLTDKQTFSGAEDFAYGLQQAKRATIVGDTSGGGAHPSDKFSIGQGFVMGIPFLRSANAFSKTDWEGTGVRPDIPVTSDKALAKAQALILTDAISKTTDEEEKTRLQYSLSGTRPKLMPKDSIKLTKETLLKYCGVYLLETGGGQTYPTSVILKCDNIYIPSDLGRDDTRLIPISPDTFIYDDTSGRTLEFVTGKDGTVSQAVFRWWTGVFTVTKKQ